ncbi:hypothetical protein PTTG_27032 [Puccinia triticina 1-1 BBBD Race 1]|uniref:Uncharacterized protein n=1 Tax=Puccinia triticina (isolate 1-1 / race 1 (BBBD)) TaxID=630390 RepID=A0A180GNA0_PUCT1|nr:hypothetical protein PTTG_27032 [Puccinia triticina 1-1 BBBD Race 1]
MRRDKNNTLKEYLQELRDIWNLIELCRKDRLFKPTDKGCEVEPHLPTQETPWMQSLVNRIFEAMRLNEFYEPTGTSSTAPFSKLKTEENIPENTNTETTNEKTLEATMQKSLDVGLYDFLLGTGPEPGKLSGDVLDTIIDMAKWEWLKKLNDLLHRIQTLQVVRNWIRIPSSMHPKDWEFLSLQQLVFRAVEILHKSKIIPPNYLEIFLQQNNTRKLARIITDITEEAAAGASTASTPIFHHKAPWYYTKLWLLDGSEGR